MNKIEKFSDVIDHIEQRRKIIFETNPFFKTLVDESLSVEQRMRFVPYMVFFSCGGPDVITLLMKSEKEPQALNFIEKKINAFIEEDNFHYNFYLKDLEAMGYTLDKFNSTNAVIRHVFSEESIAVRKLVYCLSHYCRQHFDPLVRLTLCELIEAGLYDLFTIIYKNIVKNENSPFAQLHYFGDAHVTLEINHTVTTWFSGQDSAVAHLEIPPYSGHLLAQVVDKVMDNFNAMYLAFQAIILKENSINPEKYNITSLPPIHQITNNAYRASR